MSLYGGIDVRGLQYRRPGRTDGEGGVDQADVGVGLRKVAELGAGFGYEMFGEEPEVVCAGEDLGHDLLRFRHPPESREPLDDPEGTDDKAGLRPSEIVCAEIAKIETGFLPSCLHGQGSCNALHRGLTDVPVGKAENRRLSKRGIVGVVFGAVAQRAVF